MLTFLLDGIRNTYNWLIKKSRSIALDSIALFNKEYADGKRIGNIVEDHPETEPKFEIKDNLDLYKIIEVSKQGHRFTENVKNVILVRIDVLARQRLGFSYCYDRQDPVYYAISQAIKINGITKGNTDLVLLLWLMYAHVPIDEHGELLKDLVKNHSGNRAEMIEKLYPLQEEGKLSITSRKSLDGIIEISPIIEKEYISNGKFSVMEMISSGNLYGLAERLTKDIEGRVKELTGIDIQYSPGSSLKNLSISAVIENYGLFK